MDGKLAKRTSSRHNKKGRAPVDRGPFSRIFNVLPGLGNRQREGPLQIDKGVVEGADGAVAARTHLERRLLVQNVVDGELQADVAQIFVGRLFARLVADAQIHEDNGRRIVRVNVL